MACESRCELRPSQDFFLPSPLLPPPNTLSTAYTVYSRAKNVQRRCPQTELGRTCRTSCPYATSCCSSGWAHPLTRCSSVSPLLPPLSLPSPPPVCPWLWLPSGLRLPLPSPASLARSMAHAGSGSSLLLLIASALLHARHPLAPLSIPPLLPWCSYTSSPSCSSLLTPLVEQANIPVVVRPPPLSLSAPRPQSTRAH